jgi:hypothetical protein
MTGNSTNGDPGHTRNRRALQGRRALTPDKDGSAGQ